MCGWDLLETVNPKISSTSGIDMSYSWSQANRLGSSGEKIGRWLPSIASHGSDIVVVRGLNMGTTSHMAGRVYMDTGVLSNSELLMQLLYLLLLLRSQAQQYLLFN